MLSFRDSCDTHTQKQSAEIDDVGVGGRSIVQKASKIRMMGSDLKCLSCLSVVERAYEYQSWSFALAADRQW